MTQGLLRSLALAAPLVVCLPFCAFGADGSASDAEDAPKIFEEFSLTAATAEAPSPPPSAPAPLPPPAPAAGIPGSAPPPPTNGNGGPYPANNPPGAYAANTGCGNCCCSDNCCGSSCQHPVGIFDTCSSGLASYFSCGDNCCPVFYSSVEATMFHTWTHGMHADSFVENLNNDSTIDLSNSEGFDRWTFSPRIVAGVQEGCWGVEGRFWYMSDSTSSLNPLFPAPGSGIGVWNEERVKAYTADFEVTRAFCCGMSKVNFYLGGRYASFEAGQGLDVSRLTSPTEIAYSDVFTDFTFNGLGITTGFFGRTPIGCDTCISLVWGLRGSVLWGDAYRAVQTSDSVIDTGSDVTSINSAEASECATAFIVEAQVGAQWDHELRCLPMSAFVRLAFEYQYWDLGSSGNAAATSIALDSPGKAGSTGSIGSVSEDLVGLTFGCGFNW